MSPDRAEEALEIMKSTPEGKNAAIIGHVTDARAGKVTLKGDFSSRILTKLTGAQLPRIC